MSLRASIELAVQLASFTNVDLQRQGLYQLRLSFYHYSPFDLSKKFIGIPFILPNAKRVIKQPYHNVLPSYILDQNNQFCCRSFLIRYFEEAVELNDVCCFRSELDVGDLYHTQFYLDIELFYSDLSMIGGISQLDNFFEDIENVVDFRCIEKKTVQISDVSSSVHHFISVDFTERFSSEVTMTVHSLITGFHYCSDRSDAMMKSLSEVLFEGYEPIQCGGETVRKVFEDYAFFILSTQNELISAFLGNTSKGLRTNLEKGSVTSITKTQVKEIIKNEHLLDHIIVDLSNIEQVAVQLLDAINKLAATSPWEKVLADPPKGLAFRLSKEYEKITREYLSHFIFKSEKRVSSMYYELNESEGKSHRKIMETIRKSQIINHIEPIPVQEISLLGKPVELPIFFEEKVTIEEEEDTEAIPSEYTTIGRHLVILVHGYQGCSYDMEKLKSILKMRYPHLDFMCSTSNENKTEGDINLMAEELAAEVKGYITADKARMLDKLSFIGYSLGGVIIRAALPLLTEYSENMHSFVTLSTPHLGCLLQSSSLVNIGMWVMKKMNDSQSLKQLLMADKKEYKETFMCKISTYPGLEWFKHVVLVSSYQDFYSPYESARVEIIKKAPKGKKKVLKEMAQNILSRVKTVHRIDVGFNSLKSGMESFIGRAAHIEFIDNEVFMKILAFCYNWLFV